MQIVNWETISYKMMLEEMTFHHEMLSSLHGLTSWMDRLGWGRVVPQEPSQQQWISALRSKPAFKKLERLDRVTAQYLITGEYTTSMMQNLEQVYKKHLSDLEDQIKYLEFTHLEK
jgi:hypothetical protein